LPIWQDIGRALRDVFEILTGGEPEPEEPEEEEFEDEGGDFEPPEEPPTGGGFFDEEEPENYTYHSGEGPYPFDWGEAEENFWDRQMDGYLFSDQDEYDRIQELFYEGFMRDDISTEDRSAAREEFYEESYIVDIDWDAFAEYYNEK